VAHYRDVIAPQIGPPIGRCRTRLIRKYNKESPLGGLIADVMRQRMHSDVAITNSGGLRADLPEGPIDKGHILDAFPFLNDIEQQLRSHLEQQGELTAGEFRDLLQISRKYAIPLLEYFDNQRITVRMGDKRVLRQVS
jgi:2',3'-cyclic-nucleotide 2'-phosphodiesterase (5'-nucleotidase family)